MPLSSIRGLVALTTVLLSCAPTDHHHDVHHDRSATTDGGKVVLTWRPSAADVTRTDARFVIEVKGTDAAVFAGAAVNLEFRPETDGSDVFVLPTTESATTPGTYESDAHTFAKAENWEMQVHVNRGTEGAADHVHDHATFLVEVP